MIPVCGLRGYGGAPLPGRAVPPDAALCRGRIRIGGPGAHPAPGRPA
jgi:hypothetical protein